jgi:ABC-type uncharacterized transport system substrate-binding protein
MFPVNEYAEAGGLMSYSQSFRDCLGNLAHSSYAPQIRAIEAGARALGVQVTGIGVRGPNDFEAAFRAARKSQALIQLDDVLFSTHRSSLVELAVANRLLAIYGFREHVEAGGLMSYGANFRELYRRAAVFVDKILRGAKPGDLPVEQPTKFELVINLMTRMHSGLRSRSRCCCGRAS